MKVIFVTCSKLNVPYSYKLKSHYFCKNFSTLTEVAKFFTQCSSNVYLASEQPEMSKRENQILVKKIQAYRRKHPIRF
jgi:hypothetical protein